MSGPSKDNLRVEAERLECHLNQETFCIQTPQTGRSCVQIGGPLPQDASGGSTRVYINGRELGKRELRLFKFAGAKLKSNKRIWLDADGAYGEEGGPAKGNMWELVRVSEACNDSVEQQEGSGVTVEANN